MAQMSRILMHDPLNPSIELIHDPWNASTIQGRGLQLFKQKGQFTILQNLGGARAVVENVPTSVRKQSPIFDVSKRNCSPSLASLGEFVPYCWHYWTKQCPFVGVRE